MKIQEKNICNVYGRHRVNFLTMVNNVDVQTCESPKERPNKEMYNKEEMKLPVHKAGNTNGFHTSEIMVILTQYRTCKLKLQ